MVMLLEENILLYDSRIALAIGPDFRLLFNLWRGSERFRALLRHSKLVSSLVDSTITHIFFFSA